MPTPYFQTLRCKFIYAIAAKSQRYDWFVPGELTARITAIADSYKSGITEGGMTGAAQMFVEVLAPSSQKLKARAASALLAHRACKIANQKMGRVYRGDMWLQRAAQFRAEAMQKMGDV